ncbi:MAG: nucleosidase [Bdellovibrionales bacterium]
MIFSRDTTLVVFAMRQEAKDCFDDLHMLFCGVGKVNAAHHLTKALAQWESEHGNKPALVLNLGSAGSPHFKKGEVINCTRFVQRDFDISALGCEPYANPFDGGIPAILETGVRMEGIAEGACGTGDHFETSAKQGPWNVVDMEGYALAKVCLFEKIPFGCLKYISDGADGQAAGTWEESLDVTAHRLREAVEAFFTRA